MKILLLSFLLAQGVHYDVSDNSIGGITESQTGVSGVVGHQETGTTDPTGMTIRPGVCWGGDGTCAAANLFIAGGQDTSTIGIESGDPSANCPNGTTVTVVVYGPTAITTTVLAENTDWIATAAVDTTCSALATAVDAVAGVSASCTSPDVYLALDATTAWVTLAESAAACSTVSTGTQGQILIPDGALATPAIAWGALTTSGLYRYSVNAPATGIANGLALRAVASGTHLSVGTAGTQRFIVQTSAPHVYVTGNGDFAVDGSSGSMFGHSHPIFFCGQGPNGATSVYLSPRSSGLFGDTLTCDLEDDTTEATADEVYAPYDIDIYGFTCGLTDAATDAGVVFQLRDDAADVTSATCTTGALDGSGFANCTYTDASPGTLSTIAAGSTMAMKVTAASGNLTTADIWCRLSVRK